ncbi:class I SAM-dependent methyltransferase [Microbulbifer mangrovi]|uniref:class I SAM-dependent methyltransferase n=1 Tax=Microbulbifer mangrovi TaxID=927787 RepID=UPI00099066F2|nr:methyltransferase [Microbulbifer mangrovi]
MLPLLSQLLRDSDPDTLWIADENSKPLLDAGPLFPGAVLSNRWDIARAAEARGIKTQFCDFELAAIERRHSRIIYPVSKEKAAVHYIINCAPGALREGGELLLLGSKTSGIKTYAQKAAQRFACAKQLQKHGSDYLSRTQLSGTPLGPELDDSEYTQLRQLDELDGLYSKPGLFGWNKIDTGSALLASQFDEHLPPGEIRVVDLGCGYGYLSAQLAQAAGEDCQPYIEATDNNAAALIACEKNFQAQHIAGRVVAGDAGSDLESNSADLLVCNPPFHQGFQVEGDLTDRFLGQAARILRKGGSALFVVNEFIPLEKKAQSLFQQIVRLNKEKGFCVYHMTR